MKNQFSRLTALVLILISFSSAAQVKRCSTMEHEAALLKQDPTREIQRKLYEEEQAKTIGTQQRTQAVVTIPVVVHVLYSNSTQNISDAQIQSQIEVLNKDFGRYNSDTANTPAAFRSVAAASNIQFCLAQRTPAGLPTNGIERRSTTVTSWSLNNDIKSFSAGGLDAWNPSQYFNIWVGRLGNFILGYAEFPTASLSNTYGAVIDYRYFGTMGTAQAPFNLGRTATHEVGHCFNLYHIWGDDGNACGGTDYCADTPNQGGENYNCPTFPLTDNCSAVSPGVMFMNYMDYTNDNCMNLFTQNQVNRINNTINTAPYNALASSNGCVPVTSTVNDAGVSAIISPTPTVCGGQITPSFELYNYGSAVLTSATITYSVDGGTPLIYNWTGTVSSNNSIIVTLPAITVAVQGAHTFSVTASLPNGQTDDDPSNNTETVAFNVGGSTAAALPYTQGFESGFPAAGMVLVNPDNDITWALTSQAAKSGLQSIFMDNFDYDAAGEIDDVILPAVDLTSGSSANTTPYVSFEVAYRLYTSPTAVPSYSDTLEVLISTDCGSSFTSVYKKFGAALTTTTPVYSTAEFVPNSTQWRKDSISLGSFQSATNAIIKFRHITDYENNLFLDDINIAQRITTGLTSITPALVSVYPNPVKDILRINILKAAQIQIYTVDGRRVFDSLTILNDNEIQISTGDFPAGVYIIRATSAEESFTTRFVKE